uniref:Uncharacterized protein n=1 Tax=Arundo donax TaxID=35708 RepID=A0A0A9HA63_ARUDO
MRHTCSSILHRAHAYVLNLDAKRQASMVTSCLFAACTFHGQDKAHYTTAEC